MLGMERERRSAWAAVADSPAVRFIYAPVRFGLEHSPHFEWVLVRYLALWNPDIRAEFQRQP
jgi:hypothetical protein